MNFLSTPLRNLAKWFVAVLLLLGAAPGWATTWTVTSGNDSGSGTLRTIIAGASSGDTIYFASSLGGQTIHLTSGELSIGKSLTIDASELGTAPIIDAGGVSRVMEITAGNVTVAGLTLTNGACPAGTQGGGVEVDTGASLYLNSATITGCTANNASVGGGIEVDVEASLTFVFCTISNCIATNGNSAGGGIFSDGTALLEYSTLAGNTSDSGGGIYDTISGALTLYDCTLANNSALGGGGAIYNYGGNTVITLVNCTLAGNSAGYGDPGIYIPGGESGKVVLTNTIVTGQTTGPYTGVNNFTNLDPMLAPLGNYGGHTLTMQPLSGSPVIDAGNDSVKSFLTIDQRALPRLSGAHVDIGADEAQYNSTGATPPVLKNVKQSNGQFQFGFTNAPILDFTALTSTNAALPLSNWTVLGNVPEVSPGQYQFTNTSATNRAQFYRVVSP